MNAIKSYLDNMFRNLPNTEEVRRAKSELLQMMEDKFEELISEGKTENEAVGVVISEFGNLDEVAESIGISQIIRESSSEPEKPMLSSDRVREYLSAVSSRSLLIPGGVGLCIMSVVTGAITEVLSFGNDTFADVLGTLLFFGCIAVAVVMFIVAHSKNSMFSEINKDEVSLGVETADYVLNERRRFRPTYSTMVAIGVALCILCIVFPIIVSAIPFVNDNLGGVLFFFSIALGVYLIVSANVRMNGYDRLLKLNKAGLMSEEFIPKEDRKISKAPIIISIIVVVLVIIIAIISGVVKVFGFIASLGEGPAIVEEYELNADDVDSVSRIDVEAVACSITIEADDDIDGIEARYEGAEDLMPEVEFVNGELRITQDVQSNVNHGINDGPNVYIFVGSDVDIEDIALDMTAGNLELNGVVFDEVSGEFDAGNITVNHSTGAVLDISADAGNLDISDSDIERINIDTDAGNIEIDHTAFENLYLSSEFGNIEVRGIDDIDYYSFNVECDLGSVEIDGHDEGAEYQSEGTGTGTITADCSAGSIEIG